MDGYGQAPPAAALPGSSSDDDQECRKGAVSRCRPLHMPELVCHRPVPEWPAKAGSWASQSPPPPVSLPWKFPGPLVQGATIRFGCAPWERGHGHKLFPYTHAVRAVRPSPD
jgi:hypothetical protein